MTDVTDQWLEFKVRAGESLTDAEFLLSELCREGSGLCDPAERNVVHERTNDPKTLEALSFVLGAARVSIANQGIRLQFYEHDMNNQRLFIGNSATLVLRAFPHSVIAQTILNFLRKIWKLLDQYEGQDRAAMVELFAKRS